uniref:Transmembrane protein n=1 Tax=Meloidogyne incognita TaxID=6306 RepID=A0A914NLJ9_MELIC
MNLNQKEEEELLKILVFLNVNQILIVLLEVFVLKIEQDWAVVIVPVLVLIMSQSNVLNTILIVVFQEENHLNCQEMK